MMTRTERNIIDALHCTNRTWDKVKNNLTGVSVINTKLGNYGLCYQGVFLGAFMNRNMIDLEELKHTCFKYEKNHVLGKVYIED